MDTLKKQIQVAVVFARHAETPNPMCGGRSSPIGRACRSDCYQCCRVPRSAMSANAFNGRGGRGLVAFYYAPKSCTESDRQPQIEIAKYTFPHVGQIEVKRK